MQSKKGLGTELVGVNICDLNNYPSLVPRLSPEDEWGAHKTAGNEATIILASFPGFPLRTSVAHIKRLGTRLQSS